MYHDTADLEVVGLGAALFSKQHTLQGPNWIITGDDEVALGEARDALGGKLHIASKR